MKKGLVAVILFVVVGLGFWVINYLALIPQAVSEKIPFSPVASPHPIPKAENTVPYRLEEVAQGLVVPWSIVFTSPTRMLVTERSGSVRVIENGQLQAEPLKRFEQISADGEEGLMGITLDPNYPENKYVYVCYAYSESGGLADKVVRLTDTGTALENETSVITTIPAAKRHAGCHVAFGPDQKLYISTGDASDKDQAQRQDSLGGKILRINADGSIPEDNPFKDSPVYSLGHRNPQGFDWHPQTQALYETEHGPSGNDGPGGGDEVNLIKAGQNYGWPVVSHRKTQMGMENPLLVFTPAVAPGSAAFYKGDVFPQFKNNFFFGALKDEGLYRVVFDETDSSKVSGYEKISGIEVGRVRFVTTGPDGYVYFTSSNRDGRGRVRDNDDKIYRLVPAQ